MTILLKEEFKKQAFLQYPCFIEDNFQYETSNVIINFRVHFFRENWILLWISAKAHTYTNI